MTKPPESISLSAEETEALIARVHQSGLSAQDAGVVEQVIRMYGWVVLCLQEAKLSLQRLRSLLFGSSAKPRKPPESPASLASILPVGDWEGAGASLRSQEEAPGAVEIGVASETAESEAEARRKPSGGHRAGTGRLGADA